MKAFRWLPSLQRIIFCWILELCSIILSSLSTECFIWESLSQKYLFLSPLSCHWGITVSCPTAQKSPLEFVDAKGFWERNPNIWRSRLSGLYTSISSGHLANERWKLIRRRTTVSKELGNRRCLLQKGTKLRSCHVGWLWTGSWWKGWISTRLYSGYSLAASWRWWRKDKGQILISSALNSLQVNQGVTEVRIWTTP